ncbi:MAG: hypothetical protein L6Q71_10330, partial [Planctomycetes bacterium]|nr:hypothetical protein [Planctomycetota bacterium]
MIQWDIATGKEVQDFKGHKARITVVEPSPDGNLLLSASEDGFIKVWNLEDGKLIHTLAGHMGGRDNNDDPGFGVL